MPYNYVHLISSVTTLYLAAYSFHKGLGFLPGASLLNGLVLPLLNVAILVSSSPPTPSTLPHQHHSPAAFALPDAQYRHGGECARREHALGHTPTLGGSSRATSAQTPTARPPPIPA